MNASDAQRLSERYAHLSDRFRSLWTFYQFLGGVFKHLGEGTLPYTYDFQALYRRLQDLVPRMEVEPSPEQYRELEKVERELTIIQAQLAQIESAFPPSILRRFFDHLKKQDDKILFALVKFYLLSDQMEQDAFDKLDILLTRLAEAPLEDGRVLQRDASDMRATFERLAEFANTPVVPLSEERPLVEAVQEFRHEIADIGDFQELLGSQIFDRYRKLKQRLGRALLHPAILVEIIACNIEAKNRFRALYQEEEVRILEDTNRILEIERYLDRNPDLAHEELQRQIDIFRQSRVRYDTGRKDGNLKRESILQMREAMHAVLEAFDRTEAASPPIETPEPEPPPSAPTPTVPEAAEPAEPEMAPHPTDPAMVRPPPVKKADDAPPPLTAHEGPATELGAPEPMRVSVAELLPHDPMLDAAIHKIVYALDLVVWDHEPEQVLRAKELHYLRLEGWEIDAYRKLSLDQVIKGSIEWELNIFYLSAAALRVKIEEEIEEIEHLLQANRADRIAEAHERSAQSLDRAREVSRRFQWFIDDMLRRGEATLLEQVNRSHFRFLRAYSTLWLDHQTSGGLTPL